MLKVALTDGASYDCRKDNIIYINFLNNFMVIGLYALKSDNYILILTLWKWGRVKEYTYYLWIKLWKLDSLFLYSKLKL